MPESQIITEGELLKRAIRGKGLTIEKAATLLRVSRSKLQIDVKSNSFSDDYKQLIKDRLLIDLDKLKEEQEMETIGRAVVNITREHEDRLIILEAGFRAIKSVLAKYIEGVANVSGEKIRLEIEDLQKQLAEFYLEQSRNRRAQGQDANESTGHPENL